MNAPTSGGWADHQLVRYAAREPRHVEMMRAIASGKIPWRRPSPDKGAVK